QVRCDLRDLPTALADFGKAVRLYERQSSLSDAERRVLADAHTERGKILFQQEHYPDALQAFTKALAVLPKYPVAHQLRGGVLLHLKRYAEALRDFDAYLKEGKPQVEVYEALALARTGLRDYAGAVADYSRALELEPGSKHLHAQRGW